MVYTAINTFYLTDKQLQNTPSRKDGIDEATEMTLRRYGCDLIQESCILLKVSQEVMVTGQVLFHRFYCKTSFAHFNVKRVAATCVWISSKVNENLRSSKDVLNVFRRMECRREDLPIQHLDVSSKEYSELEIYERHILKELAFICHVDLPYTFIYYYAKILKTPEELTQEALNLADVSLWTTLCVRFKSEVLACGFVYAAARRCRISLPENPPWWNLFDVDKKDIDEVCRVLAHLYTLPKAQYVPVCKESDSFTVSNRSWELPCQPFPKVQIVMHHDANTVSKSKEHTTDTNRNREGDKERERLEGRDRKRGRDFERERERDGDKVKDRRHWSKKKPKHHSYRDRGYHGWGYMSSEKNRNGSCVHG